MATCLLIPLLFFLLSRASQAASWLEEPLCPGVAPENGWPPEPQPAGTGIIKSNYILLSSLCPHDPSFPAEAPPNLGCLCSKDGSVICFLQNLAPLLALYCEGHCQCSVPRKNSFRDRLSQSWRARPVDHPALVRKKSDKVMPAVFDGQVKSSKWCGFGCTSFSDCAEYEKIPGCDGIVCEPTEASAGLYFGIGSCVFPGRKRDISMACSCNSTYVSHSCCTSRNGLVWEDPEMKLGVMDSTLR